MMAASHSTAGDGMLFIYAGLALGALVAAATLLVSRRGPGGKATSATTNGHQNGHGAEQQSDAEKWPAGPLSIYFGSQTGTAEGFAKTLAEEGSRRGFQTQVIDLEDFDEFQLSSAERALFVLATYGEGDPTDNAVAFMDWLKQAAKDGALASADLRYTIFGLGNRQYEHFNRTGRTADACLADAGAQRMYAFGEGDDDGTLEDDFEAWKESMWEAVAPPPPPPAADGEVDAAAGGRRDSAAADFSIPELPFEVEFLSRAEAAAHAPTPESEAAASTRFFWQARGATLAAVRELRAAGADGSTLHLEVDLGETDLKYETADNMAVLPENPAAAVQALAAAQGYKLEAYFVVKGGAGGGAHKAAFPTPCTVREALTRYVDVCGVPRKGTLERLVSFAQQPEERERLARLVSREGREEFRAYVTDARRTLAELLSSDFPSVRVPLAHLLHAVPHLQPREYTISSSSAVHPSCAHLTVAVLREDRGGGRAFAGLCTSHLAALPAPGSKVHALIRASTFRLPADDSVPIILVGPGTGIAPMRALLQERRQRGARGAAVLYFGCRSASRDFLYREELEGFARDSTLSLLRTAFSRDQAAKVYVQDRLREDALRLWDYVSAQGAHVYVCGGTAMGADVQAAFADIARGEGGLGADEARVFMQRLHAEGRYVQELWS